MVLLARASGKNLCWLCGHREGGPEVVDENEVMEEGEKDCVELDLIAFSVPVQEMLDVGSDMIMGKTLGNCAVCMEKMSLSTSRTLLACTHSFHEECLERWVTERRKRTCPMCRTPIDRMSKDMFERYLKPPPSPKRNDDKPRYEVN